MKKVLLACFLAANIFMLTSCLDDGEGQQQYYVFGYAEVDYITGKVMVYVDDNYLPYCLTNYTSASIMGNECCYVYVTVKDIDNPDPYTTGYYNAIGEGYEVIPSSYTIPVADSTGVKQDEMATLSLSLYSYARNYLIMSSTHENVGEKQENSYELSYDSSQTPVVDNGNNVYNLYYRVRKTKEGSSPIRTQEIINGYRIGDFLTYISREEEAKGKSEYCIRINYISEFGQDSVPTWKATETIKFQIPE